MEIDQLRQAAILLERLGTVGRFTELSGMIQKFLDTAYILGKEKNSPVRDYIEFEKTPSFSGSRFLTRVIDAIDQKNVLKVYYKPYEEDKPYFTYIHPYLLKEYHYRWYLVGLNEQRERSAPMRLTVFGRWRKHITRIHLEI